MFVQWVGDHKHLYPDISEDTGFLPPVTLHGSPLWTQLSSLLQHKFQDILYNGEVLWPRLQKTWAKDREGSLEGSEDTHTH